MNRGRYVILGFAAVLAACDGANLPSVAGSEDSAATGSGDVEAKLAELHSEIRNIAKARSTPDETVRSFLQIADLRRKEDCYHRQIRYSPRNAIDAEIAEVRDETYLALLSGRMRDVLGDDYEPGSLDECLDRRQITSYEIRNIRQETPTSAMVEAHLKNATPIPPGAEGTEYGPGNLQRRNAGEVVRFQLEKTAAGWTISQTYDFQQADGSWKPYFDNEDYGPQVPWIVIPF